MKAKKRTQYDRQYDLLNSAKQECRRFFRHAEKDHWPQSKLLPLLAHQKKRLADYGCPIYMQEFLRGYCEALHDAIHEKQVFCYVHDGKPVAIGTDEYRAISPMDIDTNTGYIAWNVDGYPVYFK